MLIPSESCMARPLAPDPYYQPIHVTSVSVLRPYGMYRAWDPQFIYRPNSLRVANCCQHRTTEPMPPVRFVRPDRWGPYDHFHQPQSRSKQVRHFVLWISSFHSFYFRTRNWIQEIN